MSSVLIALLALGSANSAELQVNDPSATARNAYTSCLRQFMQRSSDSRMSLADFRTQLPQQCTTQEQAFREALVRREQGFRTPRAEAEEIANMEVEDARANFLQLFEGQSQS